MLPLGLQRHEHDLGEGVRVIHVERWLDRYVADLSLRVLLERVRWRQEKIRCARGEVPLPRLTTWWGEKPYTYSGITHPARPWPEWLEHLVVSIGLEASHDFNGALGNYYRDGCDHVSWHADDEDGLELDPVVASVSFGAQRRFLMRRTEAPQHKLDLTLGHGDLLVMGRGCQSRWQHAIPRQAAVTEPRISLTFRRMAL